MNQRIPYYDVFKARLPDWLLKANQQSRDQLEALTLRAEGSCQALRTALSHIPDPSTFALERLQPMLDSHFGTGVDPEKVTIERRWRPSCLPSVGGPINASGSLVSAVLEPLCPGRERTSSLLRAALVNYPSPDGFGDPEEAFTVHGSDQVRPRDFVKAAYLLDIGGAYQRELNRILFLDEHISSVLEHAFVAWQQAQLALAICEARLQGHIAPELADRLGSGQLAGSAREVRVFGCQLEGAFLYDGRQEGAVLYAPNAPGGALHGFAHADLARDYLVAVLRNRAGRAFALRLARLNEQPQLARQLAANLGDATDSPLVRPVAAASAAHAATVRFTERADDDPAVQFRQWRACLLSNARVLAVPSQDLVTERHGALLAQWINNSEQGLFISAMLVPGCQPLGWGRWRYSSMVLPASFMTVTKAGA
ncbi:dermonecrotic toxin domain-containing protein [Pseudomonas sp. KNUC1026]|uniref:dermonecrotic toxin domain-containing protein n=1 Tax=Pseudomonas sp. KNUC1026 TaxID=2893890 RepID=UPI002E34C1C8|nr:DUF6543 domain-containing protein [Pseudomonas sp. KNUC1026]